MKLLLKYGWILFLVTGLCGSCRNKDGLSEGSGTGKPLEIVAEIKGAEVSKSRTTPDDFGSKAGFSAGDKIGFYSMRDEKGDENNGYKNVPMQYDAQEKCFKKEDLIVEYPNNFGYTFAYYPYQDQTEPNVIDIYKDDNTIEDLLIAGTSQISGGRIYLSFVHAFSMLIIVPGNGFEKSATDHPANEVSVTLKKGWKASVVKGTEKIELQLEPDETAPKKFVAQRRENVSYVKGQTVPVCYSVILPNGAEIDHIEMKDDHGTTQLIVPQLEALKRSWRYPIKVSMEGTTPTVWPYEILSWTPDDSPIELGGTYGIKTSDDFKTWVTQYYRYTSGSLSDEEKTQVNEALSAFGEMTDGKWRFQLNADIDCKGLFGDNPLTSVVARLTDEFDGKNHTLSNLNTTLIGSIEENGKITDLNIDVVSITSETTEPTGALALEMTGGEISNCDIKNIQIETNGPVGALVGKATAGTISGNTVNGLLLGKASSDDGLTGLRDEGVECVNNQSSALIFWTGD
ncbi:fimbrillin family protein [Phocaeicola plebeius]|uniref:fimbrillin family protein n=1 Tax=Phocaeicola plebeius TaxID=310297 RepID=UPI0026EBCD6E|nr:fimbrillin family protein [Phocaeicola plebeius]